MKNYFEHIKYKYDSHTCTLLKHYANTNNRIAKQRSHLTFLLECQKYGIIPHNIKHSTKQLLPSFETGKIKNLAERIEHNFHTKLNKLNIKQTNITIHNLTANLIQTKNQIRKTLTTEEFNSFTSRQSTSYRITFNNIQETKTHKLQQLKSTQFKHLGLKFNSDWFINNTNIEFPKETQWLLSMGNKFALPIHKEHFSTMHVIAGLEQGVQMINDETEKDIARIKIADTITNYKRRMKNTNLEKYILAVYRNTTTFLKKHKNKIVITTADKGKKTVVMYKDEYDTKMHGLLEDKTTYKTSRTDPTNKLQNLNNKIVTDLYKNKQIDSHTKNKLTCNAAVAPRLYGLPKIHKTDIPLRPISSSTNLPCYTLSKHIGDILKRIISPDYNIKNSQILKAKLEDIILEQDDILVSFDAVSLFTNIPTNLAIRNIMDNWTTISKHTDIPKQKFLKILNFCLIDNNYFIFDSKTYTQTYGMPMGNPLSPTIADIVLDKLLDQTYTELEKHNIKIKFLVKYVDDMFAIIDKKDINSILTQLNNYHNKLQFTVETETNGCLPFLNMKIHREQGRLITDWYMKTTSSGRIINYISTQPHYQKINTAYNLINTVIGNSHQQFHEKNFQIITDILRNNNYPNRTIKNLIHRKKNNITKGTNNSTDKQPIKYIGIPFIPSLTEEKILTPALKNNNIKLAHKPNHTLNTLFTKTKTRIDKLQQSNVVYEITCKGNTSEDCKQVYIGTTKRSLDKRMTEHKADIKNKRTSTALSQHILEHNHTADFDSIKILEIEKHTNRRFTLESLHIQQKLDTVINTKEDKDKINNHYHLALKQ